MGCVDSGRSNRFIDSLLKKCFFKLGVWVGTNPGYFIIIPALLTALCASGFQQMNYNYDPEYLFSPSTGRAKMERDTLEQHFPTNYSQFKASRMSRVGNFGRLIVTPKDGGSMLRTHLWDQLLYLDQIVYNVSVKFEDMTFTYEDICARWNTYCYDNEVLRLANIMPSIESREINITYPIYFDPFTFETYTLPAFFGGVSLSELNTVNEAKAVSVAYFLDVSESWQKTLGYDWEAEFLKELDRLAPIFAPDLKIGKFVSNTPAWEMENSKNSVTGTLIINVGVMVIFSLISCSSIDSTRSKPLIGFSGLLSASVATIAGFGFACYVGVEFISLNFAAPFLLLGIGIDDTFVMLSAWRRSSSHIPVPERLGRCYQDAAVSITVTSLTDFLSFMAGVITPFPCVRIFCLYTGISVAFIYIWHLTLFGGFLAIAGFAEKKNLHGMFCVKVLPKSLSTNKSWWYRTFMSGGINPKDPHNPKDNREDPGMVFFRDHFGRILNKTWFKSLVLLIFGIYIVLAVWGVTNVKEGLDKKNTANYDSYSVQYYTLDDQFFREYAYTINVVIATNEDVKYSEKKYQNQIEKILQALENSTYIDASISQSWLRDFLDYIKRNEGYQDIDLAVSTEDDFIRTLRTVYLTDPSSPLSLDVQFNAEYNRIMASRFLIHGHNIIDSNMEQKMVADLREICDRYSTNEIEVSVFQPYFIYIDQYLAITPQTIQCILVTSLVMMLVSFLLIPSFICSLWVAFSIVSIELGVVGYMTWWEVSLDGVALINLIMCIGFSVDFSAHICYHYISETSKNPDQRIQASLYALGLPIVQGAASTILGVFGLAFANSYLFVTFFKMIFLVILLGAIHGLILLPVLLSLFGPGACGSGSSTKSKVSAASTPSTTISCRMRRPDPSCYTVNLGYVSDISTFSTPVPHHRSITPSPTSSTGTSTPPSRSAISESPISCSDKRRHHHHHHHRRHHRQHRNLRNEISKHRYPYITRNNNSNTSSIGIGSSTGSVNSGLTPDYNYKTSGRLAPVLESEEHNQQLAIINHLRRSAANVVVATPSTNTHKRVSRSKSHGPQTDVLQPKIQDHTPLRKYHSFPYEMFNNETGYSSDESIRSCDN